MAESTELEETLEALRGLAHRRFGKIPADVLAKQVVARSAGADWPVREAAMAALLRRYRFAQRDELVVAASPARGVLGTYKTARRTAGQGKRGERPYTTLLASVEPLDGSCDCADFLRSSLGVCKHLLAILDHLYVKAKGAPLSAKPARAAAALRWIPDLPLDGPLDRLSGLRLATRSEPRPRGWADAGGGLAIERRVLQDLARRTEVLRSLAAMGRTNAEPAARALVVEELERAQRQVELHRVAARAASHLKTLGRTLYPYQRDGVMGFLQAGRLLLADDMGLGKTTQAIAACHALHREGSVRKGLLIVPASLKSQWLREWQDTTDVPAAIVEGTPAERARQYRELRSGFLIMGYEQLLKDFLRVQHLAADIVVLDEAQRIKNWATKSAAYVKALTPRYRLVLTGTPMENRLEELASVLDWVDDVALAPKWRLNAWHTTDEGDGGRGATGARNLATLRERLRPCMVRRVRKDVLSQLPSRTDTRVPVSMTEQQRAEHDVLSPSIAAIAARARSRPLSQPEFLRLMQLLTKQRMISNGLGQVRFDELWPTYQHARPDEALLEGLFAPKLLELRRLVDELALRQERKVVVFSQWRRMLRLAEWSVRDQLADQGLRGVFFTGAESQRLRSQAIVEFHDDPAVRVMFLSDAGGVGLNLQRAASACINLELPWNPAVLEQRIGRIYRLGQKRPIDVYNLASEYGIESRIADLVASKKALFTGLFDGTSDAVQFAEASSFMSDVEKIVAVVPEASAPEAADFEGQEEADDLPSDESPVAEEAATAPSVAQLFAGVHLRRTGGGGVVIEATPEAASSLVAMFEGMAKLLAGATREAR